MSKLVHVVQVEMAKTESLTSMIVIDNKSCRFKIDVFFEKCDIRELAGVTIEDTYENNQKVYTTTVTFQTCDKLPMNARHMAFRLTSLDGKRYMVGTGARPYPIIKERNLYPEKPADSQMKVVTVTWKSLMPMLLIIE